MGRSKITFLASMFIFGTIGCFRRAIFLPSGSLAMFRGLGGALFLLGIMRFKKQSFQRDNLKSKLPLVILSGIFLGLNWILLFEAYITTTVSIATLSYYMAPVFVILFVVLTKEEAMTKKKLIQCISAVCGIILLSGVMNQNEFSLQQNKGIIFGLSAAVFYAAMILCNRKLNQLDAYEKTIIQLFSAGLVLIPYVIFVEGISLYALRQSNLLSIITVVLLHTGVAYMLYFDAVGKLPASLSAVYSYFDPLFAVVLSALFLEEHFGLMELLGTILILGSTLLLDGISSKKINIKKDT